MSEEAAPAEWPHPPKFIISKPPGCDDSSSADDEYFSDECKYVEIDECFEGVQEHQVDNERFEMTNLQTEQVDVQNNTNVHTLRPFESDASSTGADADDETTPDMMYASCNHTFEEPIGPQGTTIDPLIVIKCSNSHDDSKMRSVSPASSSARDMYPAHAQEHLESTTLSQIPQKSSGQTFISRADPPMFEASSDAEKVQNFIAMHQMNLSEQGDLRISTSREPLLSNATIDVEDESFCESIEDELKSCCGSEEPDYYVSFERFQSQGNFCSETESGRRGASKAQAIRSSSPSHKNGSAWGQLHVSLTAAPAINASGCAWAVGANTARGDEHLTGPKTTIHRTGATANSGTAAEKTCRSTMNCMDGPAGYISDASSAGLDDADHEVRNLTARAFRSLSCPYDAFAEVSPACEESPFAEMPKWPPLTRRGSPHWAPSYVDLSWRRSVVGRGKGNSIMRQRRRSLEEMGGGSLQAASQLKTPCEHNASLERMNEPLSRQQSRESDAVSQGGGAVHQTKHASSLLTNVLSKKMQQEQELRMERGELRDTSAAPDVDTGLSRYEFPAQEELTEDLSFAQDHVQCPISASNDGTPHTEDDDLWQAQQVTVQRTVTQNIFLQSENSAFHSWRDRQSDSLGGKEVRKLEEVMNNRAGITKEITEKIENKSSYKINNTLYIKHSSQSTVMSKSPEIKINLQKNNEQTHSPFSIAKLLTPNICTGTVDQSNIEVQASKQAILQTELEPKTGMRAESQCENPGSTDKLRMHTPLHQVRDVRKLVKCTYTSMSREDSDGRSTASDQSTSAVVWDMRLAVAPRSVCAAPPLVINCKSITRKEDTADSMINNGASVLFPQTTKSYNMPQQINLRENEKQVIESNILNQESSGVDISPTTNEKDENSEQQQQALDKLTAAVKSMEDLYVFENNGWKRRKDVRPAPHSNVLSLITMEEVEKAKQNLKVKRNDVRASSRQDRQHRKSNEHSAEGFGTDTLRQNKGKSLPSRSHERPEGETTPEKSSKLVQAKESLASADSEVYFTIPIKLQQDSKAKMEVHGPPKVPPKTYKELGQVVTAAGARVQHRRHLQRFLSLDGASSCSAKVGVPSEKTKLPHPLTIQPPHLAVSPPSKTTTSLALPVVDAAKSLQCSEQVMPLVSTSSVPTPSSTCSTFQNTQRRLLLDPESGQFYLVDMPIHPQRKRLLDPDTGQFIEVVLPASQQVLGAAPGVFPVPVSPFVIGGGTFATPYVVYPGVHTLPVSQQFGAAQVAMGRGVSVTMLQALETDLTSSQSGMVQAVYAVSGAPVVGGDSKPPVISITSSQGPRIVAPTSFDGSTMSFVVEHK
uniref:DUF4585 domain-containing protein n=1 Tax=Eptatretus burgeri TaxID=7764 RepID=A0A8C4Q602_EPTBU